MIELYCPKGAKGAKGNLRILNAGATEEGVIQSLIFVTLTSIYFMPIIISIKQS